MKAALSNPRGYQGSHMSLPVAALEKALPFYESVLGFRVVSRSDTPFRSAVLGRDGIEIALAEHGGDPEQDGCAFEVDSVDAAFAEFKANGLAKDDPGFGVERHGGTSWKVLYVVAPDGLCYWFGERQAGAAH